MEQLKEKLSDLEDRLSRYSSLLPKVGRCLLVLTFMEDALRLLMQWEEQSLFLRQLYMPSFLVQGFLLSAMLVQTFGSFAVLARMHLIKACYSLIGFVVAQMIVYGSGYLEGHLQFLLRNLSLIGGLLMLIAEEKRRTKDAFQGGLLTVDPTDASTYLQLFGRILLGLLFLVMAISSHSSGLQKGVSWIALVAALSVAVGFKARYMTVLLAVVLLASNVFSNNFWSLSAHDTDRDVHKYYFFQSLSILGGLLLLVSLGPGGMSIDEKKKLY
eukprot:Rmarinus@m.2622